MANLIDVKVPDIGDFKDVPVIDVLVRPGDRVTTEQALITLESDKASMDVPSPLDGVVKELMIKVGDKVSQGSLILVAEAEAAPAGVAPKQSVKGEGAASGEGAPVADYGAASGVYEVIEVRVPDIGDFKDVPIIEVAVKNGDAVQPEQPLITLESDKASMEVPSPAGGTVKEMKAKIGDKVRAGSLILTLQTGVSGAAPITPSGGRGAAASGTPVPDRGNSCRWLRRRMRNAGPWRGARRLFRGISFRRSRHDDGFSGTLPNPRWRLSQRWLYPFEGAAPYRRGHGRGQSDGGARNRVRPAADRLRQVARP